MGGHRIT